MPKKVRLYVRDETDSFWYVVTGVATRLLNADAHKDTVGHKPVAGDLIFANASGQWDALPIGTAGYFLKAVGGLPAWARLMIVDTRANILATTATLGLLAYATDTYEFLIADGTYWRKVPFTLVTEPQAPDMGYTQGSSRIGYGTDYITDKLLSNVDIGNAADTTNAGANRAPIRVSSSALQVYLDGAWKDVVTGFRLREDDSGYLVFEHKPTGMTEWLEINSGNSNTLGMNGLPLIQQYGASQGAYPAKLVIDGGTF